MRVKGRQVFQTGGVFVVLPSRTQQHNDGKLKVNRLFKGESDGTVAFVHIDEFIVVCIWVTTKKNITFRNSVISNSIDHLVRELQCPPDV